ncbi:MAG TPA: DNA translocase FtsK [Crocinitomix sp.]|nr:DNA translocase FtsK [Crocinitomix sp.]
MAKKAKNKTKLKGKKVNFLKPIALLFSDKNKRLRLSTGAIFLLLSFYQLLAFISYFFTWKQDQDKVINNHFFEYVFSDSETVIDNHLGKLGAWISHQFIYEWYGLASFFFPFMFIILGIYLITKIRVLPIKKTLAVSLVGIIIISLILGFFTKSDAFPYGGQFGYQFNLWLKTTVGIFGAFLFLLVISFIAVVVLFNPNFEKLFLLIKKQNTRNKTNEDTATQDGFTDIIAVNTIKDEDIKQEEISETVDFSDSLGVKEPKDHINSSLIMEIENEEELGTEESEKSTSLEIEVKEDEILDESDIDDKLKEFGEYDPTLDLANYQLPNLELLNDYGGHTLSINKEELEKNKDRIVEVLGHYKIEISKIKATVGPTVTLYEIVPAPGIRISKIKNLADDIALSLAAHGIRIIAPIPGKGTIGIEVPNSKPDMVAMRTMIASEKFQNTDMELPIVMGKTISNETFIFDLAKAPHLLVAGATGQGKSVGLNAILVSILYKKHPAQVKFVMVDPKKVELTLYNKIERHFLAKLPDTDEAIITDTDKVVNTMNSLCIEMDTRYELLKAAHVRNLKEYNTKFIGRKLNPEKGHRFLPYIVVVIDEFADLIMTAGKEIEHPIARLAQLARAIGIHLIVATQRPSVNVITGMIKANFPARIAFKVSSGIDSKTILDTTGAEQLIGRGDMLISFGNELIRLQCAFVDTPEVEAVCDFIGEQRAYPTALELPAYVGEADDNGLGIDDMEERDALFEEAAQIIVTHQQGSASLLQRKLKIGYNRAGRIVDQMEKLGMLGASRGSKPREVLIPDLVALDQFLANLDEKKIN